MSWEAWERCMAKEIEISNMLHAGLGGNGAKHELLVNSVYEGGGEGRIKYEVVFR